MAKRGKTAEEVVEIMPGSDDDIECVEVRHRGRGRNKKADRLYPTVFSKPSPVITIDSDEDALEDQEQICIVGSPTMKLPQSAKRVFKNRPEVVQVLEARAEQIQRLVTNYGAHESGWGIKVDRVSVGDREVPSVVSLSILPSPNHRTNSETVQAVELVVVGKDTNVAEEAPASAPQILGVFINFPPIRLRAEYTSLYDNGAKFSLTCSWLLKDHLKRLTAEVERKYVKHDYDLPSTVEYMERKSVKFLGVVRHGQIIYCRPDFPNQKSHFIAYHDPSVISTMFQELHCRLREFEGTALSGAKTFECAICFDRKPAMAVVLFTKCKHFFCRACITEEFSLKIREGQVQEIRCLSHNCDTVAEMEMIKATVDFPTFRRYCDLTTESFVDQGTQFVRCPRRECNAPMEVLPNGPREIACLVCQYIFCGTCKAAAHPNTACITDEQKEEIRRTYKSLDAGGQKAMETRFGAANIKFAFEDAESEEWISKNSKPCPQCKTKIEKISGCNKMACTGKGCGVYFCWLCLAVLPKQNPYSHFDANAAGANGCAGKLHQGNPNLAANPFAGFPAFNAHPRPALPGANAQRMAQLRQAQLALAQQRQADMVRAHHMHHAPLFHPPLHPIPPGLPRYFGDVLGLPPAQHNPYNLRRQGGAEEPLPFVPPQFGVAVAQLGALRTRGARNRIPHGPRR